MPLTPCGHSGQVFDRTGGVVGRYGHHRVEVVGWGAKKFTISGPDDGVLEPESQYERKATGLPDGKIRVEPASVESENG